jgi:hypothetical protein
VLREQTAAGRRDERDSALRFPEFRLAESSILLHFLPVKLFSERVLLPVSKFSIPEFGANNFLPGPASLVSFSEKMTRKDHESKKYYHWHRG